MQDVNQNYRYLTHMCYEQEGLATESLTSAMFSEIEPHDTYKKTKH
jgi:hypothetical protein